MDSRKSEHALGLHISPYVRWLVQFSVMKEKMIGTIEKLKSTVMFTSTASVHHKMCFTRKVYFRVGVMKLMPKQE